MVTSTPKKDSHIIGGYITGETGKAICMIVHQVDGVEIELENRQHWFPFSQISSIYRNRAPGGELDTLTATHWICTQKELLK